MMIDWNRLYHYQQAMTVWQWCVVILVVSSAIWLIVWLRSYFREDADDADQTMEMLTQFRDLHQEGGLSDDEFRLIRSRLTRSAQEALVADRTKPNEMSGELAPPRSKDSLDEAPGQSTAQHAITEQDVKSERMSDNGTE